MAEIRRTVINSECTRFESISPYKRLISEKDNDEFTTAWKVIDIDGEDKKSYCFVSTVDLTSFLTL